MKTPDKEEPSLVEASVKGSSQRDDAGTKTLETSVVNAAGTVLDVRRAIPSSTVKVYTRHSTDCARRGETLEERANAKYERRCNCPKWIYWSNNGNDGRLSAKTRSWSKAEDFRQVVADSFDPIKAELKKLKETQQGKWITVLDAVQQYLSDAAARNLSQATQRKYRITVSTWLLPWAERNNLRYLHELTTPQLTKWRSTWRFAPATCDAQQRLLITFFEFCIRQDWLPQNPARRLSRIQVKRKPTDYFPREEFEKLVKATFSFGDGTDASYAVRLRILLLLMRWSGLRIGDAVTLERSRLIGDNILLYQAKTGTSVYVPLPQQIAQALREIPAGKAPNPRYFFWSGNGTAQGAIASWSHAFRRLFQIANIREPDGTPKRCHPHMLRDTFAIENLLAGIPIDQVSVLLGHASIKTTERHYAPWVRARQEQLEQSVKKAHVEQGVRNLAINIATVMPIDSERATELREQLRLSRRAAANRGSRGVLWHPKEDIIGPAANQKTPMPTVVDTGLAETHNPRCNRMAWKQCDVFPIIVEIIKQKYEQNGRFITALEISRQLLLNSEGRTLVGAACSARKNEQSMEVVASNMVAWFSARITRSETEWATAFERTRIDGAWAYKPSQP